MSISSESSDEQERRPFFGNVKPKADNFPGPRYPVTHPLTQANFVGVFTVLTIVIYTAVLQHFGQHAHLPPGKFYFALACALAVSWISLYIEGIPAFIQKIGHVMDKDLDGGVDEVDGPRPGHVNGGVSGEASSWRAPSVEQHTDEFTYDTGVVIRVYFLVASSVFFSCLFSMYSGGPFQSAYAQIIVAYPLFATAFARRGRSLAAVYGITLVCAVGFQIVKYCGYFAYPTQSTGWYIAVTGILLVASWILAYVNVRSARRRVEKAWRKRNSGEVTEATS